MIAEYTVTGLEPANFTSDTWDAEPTYVKTISGDFEADFALVAGFTEGFLSVGRHKPRVGDTMQLYVPTAWRGEPKRLVNTTQNVVVFDKFRTADPYGEQRCYRILNNEVQGVI